MSYTTADPGPPALRLASTGTLTYGLSVGEVLGVSTLNGARLIAGRSGLERIVQRLNVMEVPDILSWVKPNELLLTTGYPLRNTPQSLDNLVADLDERGLAALAIKLGRYLETLPPEMIEQADRRGFPLIQLPDDVGFDDILNQVLTDILNRQAAVLARTEEVHRALVQIVLCGGGLQEVVDEVATLLEVAVIVLDGEQRVLAGAGSEAHIQAMRALGMPGAPNLPGGPSAGTPSGGTHSAGTHSAGTHSAGTPSPANPSSSAPGAAVTQGPGGDHLVVPVVAGGFDHGRIVAYSPNGSLRETDLGILERAATVAALVVTKQQAVAAVESKYRADFLRDILAGRAGDDDRVVAHCSGFGWDLDRPVMVVVAELDGRPRNPDGAHPETDAARSSRGTEERLAQERLAAAWTAVVRRHDRGAAVASFAHEVVAVVGAEDGADSAGLSAGPIQTMVKEAGALFAEHLAVRRTFSTGISRTVATPAALPEAYEQAVKAVRVGRQLHGAGSRAHFDQLGVYRLLSLVSDPAELHAFVRETLGDLAADDEAELVDLRRTLQVLLETNLNVAETARRLHFHYNTLRYRIGKLERMLGPFTEDAHLRLNLTLALHVLRMRGI
ncbi:PucR family transcriptional regulator ligand-binding domain-containing protein [Actinomadura barringtoniae]|uniref:PucR family transcriptional regulator ligand-binding domain-containing protein n=1 Tax=Actinomadura barringtoniae TaxID=1427535 RepID=A0A939PGT2_9ACTN|nr:PucR family transcriptional regulator ligand-binding domain-containing protein [Actinomadura barringtoniae]MBO2452396.1 PucR family transcriptional regulator ligand-binding domain-containing protein [Actinomadura barringtoniae]